VRTKYGAELDRTYANEREVMSLETVTKKKMYEGMFLIDSAKAVADWDGMNAAIRKILERAETEIVSIKKWDDRRLAYEIQHVGRGTYILAYFRADGQHIRDIEKAVQLSEKILRVLILSAEHLTDEEIEKDTPAMKSEKEQIKPSPAAETIPQEPSTSPDDLIEGPAVDEEPEEAEENATVAETETKEEAEPVEESEPIGQTELTEEPEEKSEPKPAADD